MFKQCHWRSKALMKKGDWEMLLVQIMGLSTYIILYYTVIFIQLITNNRKHFHNFLKDTRQLL